MDITEYVSKVLTKNGLTNSFPDSLVVPKSFVDHCWTIYSAGERQGKELGNNILYEDGEMKVGDRLFEGTATGIDLTNIDKPENFGDLHCHPSSSVGHVGGYAAHSGEDLLAVRNNKDKHVFIRFVASDTHIYAMVYRKGHTVLDEKKIVHYREQSNSDARAFFDKHCLVNEEERNTAMLEMPGSKEIDAYITQRRRETPGLGPEMQRLSIKYGKLIADDLKFGFYSGDAGYGVSVNWYKTLTLDKLSS